MTRCPACRIYFQKFHLCPGKSERDVDNDQREIAHGRKKNKDAPRKSRQTPVTDAERKRNRESQLSRWEKWRETNAPLHAGIVELYSSGGYGMQEIAKLKGVPVSRVQKVLHEAQDAGHIRIRAQGETVRRPSHDREKRLKQGLEIYKAGTHTQEEIAQEVGVHVSTLSRFLKREAEAGRLIMRTRQSPQIHGRMDEETRMKYEKGLEIYQAGAPSIRAAAAEAGVGHSQLGAYLKKAAEDGRVTIRVAGSSAHARKRKNI